MKRGYFLVLITVAMSLGACNESLQPLGGEPVRIVAYDKGDFKTSGDAALLADDRLLQIRSNALSDLLGWPAIAIHSASVRERNLWGLRGNTEKLHGIDGIEAVLDIHHGLLCLDRCYRLMAICPSYSEGKSGKKCKSFAA